MPKAGQQLFPGASPAKLGLPFPHLTDRFLRFALKLIPFRQRIVEDFLCGLLDLNQCDLDCPSLDGDVAEIAYQSEWERELVDNCIHVEASCI